MSTETLSEVLISEIRLGKNSRINVLAEDLSGMMESIKSVGLLNPITLNKKEGSDLYEIIQGNRRYLSCKKLGFENISAIIKYDVPAREVDLMNLTENIQRKDISPVEIGRYIKELNETHLMNIAEIATRLGLSKNQTKGYLDVFNEVPLEYQDKIDVTASGDKTRAKRQGKVAFGVSKLILRAVKTYRLNKKQADYLWRSTSHPKFNSSDIPEYANQLSLGELDPVGDAELSKYCAFSLNFEESEFLRLKNKYVETGAYRSVHMVCLAVLRGSLKERVMFKNYKKKTGR